LGDGELGNGLLGDSVLGDGGPNAGLEAPRGENPTADADDDE